MTHLPSIQHSDKMATILQWNPNGYHVHLNMLKKLIANHTPDIICIQETHFHDTKVHTPKHYTGYFKNRQTTTASGGVAIYVKSDIAAKQISVSTNLEAVAVAIQTPQQLNICNIYIFLQTTI